MKCSVDVCHVHLSHDFFSSLISLLSFSLTYLSTDESGGLKSLATTVWSLRCELSFSNLNFRHVGALVT